MAILPVVGLEQVIAQSPALLSERVREQKKEEGHPEEATPRRPGESPEPPPVEGIRPVSPVGENDGTGENVEKEEETEYPVGKNGRFSGRGGSRGRKMPRHRLDIEA